MRSWVTRPNARSTMSWAPTGNPALSSARLRAGRISREADSPGGEPLAARRVGTSIFNSAGPGSAISSSNWLARRGAAQAGNLFLRVRLAKHPDFQIEDHHLVHEVEVAPWEAVLGTQIPVPTLDGRINIKVPPGTQNGQRLRVRSQGLPQPGGGRGD